MWIVVGLGNPGIAYRKSRHNAGFLALDALSDALHIRVAKRGLSGVYGEGVVGGERVVLVKPQTYMNLSGDCVQRVLHFYKAPPERLIVLYDDIDLPVGALRIRASGSAGTHNGMRSVVACVGSENFARMRTAAVSVDVTSSTVRPGSRAASAAAMCDLCASGRPNAATGPPPAVSVSARRAKSGAVNSTSRSGRFTVASFCIR